MSRRIAVVSAGYEPAFSRILEQIVRDELADGAEVDVIDIATIMSSPTISYSPLMIQLGRLQHPKERFRPNVKRIGAKYVSAADFERPLLVMHDSARTERDDAVQSALLTYFRTDQINLRSQRVRKVRRGLAEEGERSFSAVTRILEQRKYDRAYVPNGRFPAQRMAKFAFVAAGVDVRHYEKGASVNHAFVQPYSPHDRLAGQDDILAVTAHVDQEVIERVADEWLQARQPSQASTNEYSAIWAATPVVETQTKDHQLPTIGFFTSSQDEFLHLGPDWQLHRWASQFDAFSTLMTRFEANGYRCVLRVHPNLATKDHACFRREVDGLKSLQVAHPNLTIIWHDDPTSSYALLNQCDGVVVWDSTIGLEASAQGIPVWNCAASYYGLVADTRVVLGPEDAIDDVLRLWMVDPFRAKRFIAGMILRDHQLDTSAADWSTWNLSYPPFAARLAALAVSGGAPTAIDSVKSIVDPWRHRRWSINYRLAQSKFRRQRS